MEIAPRRRAKINLDLALLHEILGLPADARIVGVDSRVDPFSLSVVIEKPTLPTVPYDREAPAMRIHTNTIQVTGVTQIDWLTPDA